MPASRRLHWGELPLEEKIKDGAAPEHPAWENLIAIKNIETEIKEIENDIRTLQAV